jgi:Ankyrin repeats (3 copies)/IPT/TIG domain
MHTDYFQQHSVTQSMNGLTTSGSRETSPLSAMVTSQESSPAAFFNISLSPAPGVDFVNGTMLDTAPPNPAWPTAFENYPNHGLPMPQLNPQPMPRMAPQGYPPMGAPFKPVLTIHPTPLKSRVETQIPIKMTLFPMPMGVSKLHLPTHTISKPKLLAKPAPERSPDTLELYTTLVCTSAMQNPENRRRAFERAAAASTPDEKPEEDEAEEDEENKPLNGGDVKICPGCITRERKRAARKKVKKVEEEESWHKYEAQRVIVFNTHEVKDWQAPTSQPPSEVTGDRAEPFIPEGALQVDAPMRIACYCRHQNEKLGFQVIFTIKDHQDRLIAQEMTSSIMITDDHKTHNIPPLTTQTSSGSDEQTYSGTGAFPSDETFDMNPGPAGTMGPFRLSHSSSDLQGMQRNSNMQQFTPSMSLATSPQPSQTTSATMTPRNQSRQTSPSATSGPTSKKRKVVPTGLAMTRLETAQPGPVAPPTSLSATTSTAPSPFTPNFTNFPQPTEQQFGQPSTTMPAIPQPFSTGPPTPNSNDQVFFSNHNRSQSMENLAMAQQMYSAPTSAHPSRAPSPNGLRTSVQAYQQQQAQIAQAVANGLYGIPLSLNPHRPPTIHKLIPNEGPKAGGIEVTCLGSGFCQGLEVMFGECKATTTTFWGETSLVCLLPPSAFPGMVPVIFKHQHQQQQMQPYPTPPIPKQQAFFKYVDDDEQQIIRTALSVLGHKMTGRMEDVRDLARRIVGDGPSSWGASAGHSPSGGSSSQQGSSFNAATFGVDVEATLLRCLDLIDLDDSPNMPRLNLRRASGQTMLHLACSLGLHRFVAGLLARGANPEPRDKGGFTPMHFAALHSHPQIVRRLMLSGADPTVRSLQGYTPSDMATSEEVLRVARRIEHHTRTRSGSSLRSRTSSATSLRSLWEPSSTPAAADHALSDDSEDGDNEYEDEDADAANDGAFWMRSRRPSAQKPAKEEVAYEKDPVLELPNLPAGGLASPTAAMTAFRDQLSAHIQHIQQTMQLNLPNLPQMPRLDMMPNLPDYQAYLPTTPMVRRISNLVGNNRPEGSKEQDYRWWDLFSGTVPAAPPAYEEIFPEGDVDTKRASATQAAADAVADNKCAELFDQATAESSTSAAQKKPVVLSTVRIGQKHTITREQQDQLRLAHAEKVKRLSRDRNLFFIWVC